MKPTVYIIGGSGFIGKHLSAHLSETLNVSVFDKYIDNQFFLKYPAIKTFRLDLINETIPVEIATPDFIINLASIVTAERDMRLFESMISSNIKILLNLYERFCHESSLKLFMQFGSSEEYGNITAPFKETDREQPNSPYALIKQLTTNLALMLYQNFGFPASVIRPGNLYGPGQNQKKFIPYVEAQLKNNAPLEVSPCEQRRDFIHISDFVSIIEKLLRNYKRCVGEIINVSSGKSTSLKEIIEGIKTKYHSTSVVKYGAFPYRENEIMNHLCDISKLHSIIKNG